MRHNVEMPNQAKTPSHSFRIPERVYQAAKAKADSEGRSLSELIREFLVAYVHGN